MSEETGSVLGAGNPEPAAAQAPAPAPAAIEVPEWAAGLSDITKPTVAAKSWKSMDDAIVSYQNLEKFMGADKAGRGLVLPKDDAAPEEWEPVFQKLGKPATPNDYSIPIPEGDTGEFAEMVKPILHKANLTNKQAEVLAGEWNTLMQAQAETMERAFQQQTALDLKDLQKDWGNQFDAQAELGRRALREAGLSQEDGAAIERALGLKRAAEAFAKLGKAYQEAPIKGGEGAQSSGFGVTPADAKARIQTLVSDKEFGQRLRAGDANAKGEWDRLHQIAFG